MEGQSPKICTEENFLHEYVGGLTPYRPTAVCKICSLHISKMYYSCIHGHTSG